MENSKFHAQYFVTRTAAVGVHIFRLKCTLVHRIFFKISFVWVSDFVKDDFGYFLVFGKIFKKQKLERVSETTLIFFFYNWMVSFEKTNRVRNLYQTIGLC
jgi:hypothetical protein